MEKYIADPLVYHEGYKAKMSTELLNNTSRGKANCHTISKPILIVHGTEDQLVSISGSQFIHDSVTSEDKTMEVSAVVSKISV